MSNQSEEEKNELFDQVLDLQDDDKKTKEKPVKREKTVVFAVCDEECEEEDVNCGEMDFEKDKLCVDGEHHHHRNSPRTSKARRSSRKGSMRKSKTKRKSRVDGTEVSRATQKYGRHTTMRSTEILSKDSFEFIKELGQGAYGLVFLVKKKNTGQLYALKELKKDHIMRYDKVKSVFREKDVLELVGDHKNVVTLECTF